ncbi:MAG: shikimate dehydrogenase [Dehalococcoidales bacterium]
MSIMAISGRTRVCGVIGDPIEHTMSPVMHNAAFREIGMDYVYLPFRVARDEIGKAIAGMRSLNLAGLNVTIPHKISVVPFLDELDSLARKIGAVNTVVNDRGVLWGYNTDASGFLQAMLDKGVKPDNKKVVVLGAGGAARAICYILAESGASLSILNRALEMEWARNLAAEISGAFDRDASALELNSDNLAKVMPGSDILVNATSVGMSPNTRETPVPAELLESVPIVFDIVYNPVQTRLRSEAEQAGALTISGLDMLVCQGALSFEKWTGQKAPLEVMKKEALKGLQK